MDIDYMIQQSKIEREEFEDAMVKHLDQNPRGCEPMGDCVYCLTYGDMMRDAEGR